MRAITINNIKVYPDFVYVGEFASASLWKPWGVGEDLALTGSGTDPTVNQDAELIIPHNKAVLFSDGKHYAAGNSTFGDITTEDYVIEVVFKPAASGSAAQRFLYKRTGTKGWGIATSNTPVLTATVDGATGTVFSSTGAIGSLGTYKHCIFFADKSGSCAWYVNGVQSGTPQNISGTGSLTNSSVVRLGDDGTGNGMQQPVAWCAMWKRSDWLSTHLNEAVALSRKALLLG